MSEDSLFTAALDLPTPAEREAFLDRACGTDFDLKARLRARLTDFEDRGTLLRTDNGASPVTHAYVDSQAGVGSRSDVLGSVIGGRYRLLESVGEGGMGRVYVAEQTAPVRRRVALKLVKAGMDSRQVLARFEAERQALALMDHPNIAKILDGGLTEQGHPFFVMEFIQGVPLTEFCDAARLTVRERLELFIPVCQAVQHAHQKGVVHRDLKPSNILVGRTDGKPTPKVIDFGLAKALHQPLTDRTLYTSPAFLLGTPLYMSPEQVA
ncbi:MAG: serine/threonine-protein kinase, partial [Gemmataceae bacterium]